MGNIIGHGRYRDAYPATGTAGGAALAALRNRNVAIATDLTHPFTPNASLIAAIAFTPRVSGVLQVSASMLIENGVNPEQYSLVMTVAPGTGLSVTGGEATSDGWVMGSNTPPTVNGVTGSTILSLEDVGVSIGNGVFETLDMFGITPSALPLGVPALVSVLLGQLGAHALADLAFFNLSVMELP